ncbi:MAG: hypothetical protein AAGC46_10000, partial [Solirubrobacteraceae bacterium]|nr:hypothetical protein [Patulibacter sp.]
MKSPLTYLSGSVVYGASLADGYACFTLTPSGSDYEPIPSRMSAQSAVATWLNKVGRDGQIVRMAREWNAGAYLQAREALGERLVERSAQALAELAPEQIDSDAGRQVADRARVAKALAGVRGPWHEDHETELAYKQVGAAMPRLFLAV